MPDHLGILYQVGAPLDLGASLGVVQGDEALMYQALVSQPKVDHRPVACPCPHLLSEDPGNVEGGDTAGLTILITLG